MTQLRYLPPYSVPHSYVHSTGFSVVEGEWRKDGADGRRLRKIKTLMVPRKTGLPGHPTASLASDNHNSRVSTDGPVRMPLRNSAPLKRCDWPCRE